MGPLPTIMKKIPILMVRIPPVPGEEEEEGEWEVGRKILEGHAVEDPAVQPMISCFVQPCHLCRCEIVHYCSVL